MDPTTYLEHVRTDGVALAAAAGAGLTQQVPNCPLDVTGEQADGIREVAREVTQ